MRLMFLNLKKNYQIPIGCQILNNNDVNEDWANFSETFGSLYNECIPLEEMQY